MTASAPVSEWLRGRSPAPPSQLIARITELAAGAIGPNPTPEQLLDAAESAMARLLREGCLTRASALDLLAVDALVTYAFEAAAEAPELLDARTQRALVRLSALAEPYPA